MAIATLSIDLVAKLANIARDLAKVGGLAEKSARQMEAAFSGASSAIGSAFAGLAGAFSAGALASMVQGSIDAADALAKLSQRTGETVENLSKLQYAGRLADVSTDDLQSAMVRLNRVMGEAADGSEAAQKALARFGIEAGDSVGQAFEKVAERIKNTSDESRIASATNDVLGKSFATLLPLLKGGADGLKTAGDEAERLGVVFSTDTAQAAEKFNDNITRLQGALSAIANQTAGTLLPLLTELTDSLVSVAKESDGTDSSFSLLLETMRAMVVFGGNLAYVFNTLGGAIGGAAASVTALATGNLQLFTNIQESMRETQEAARTSFDAWERRMMAAGTTAARVIASANYSNEGRGRGSAVASGAGILPAAAAVTPPARAGRTARAIDDGQRLVDQLRDQIRATQDLSNVEKLELEIADGKYKTATAGNLEIARGYAQILDSIKAARTAAEEEADAWRERLAVLAEGSRVFAATRTPMEALNIELDRLTELLDAGAISMDTFGRAAASAGADFQKIGEHAAETGDVLEEFAKSGARNIQSAFADFLFDPFKDGMNGMLQSFGNVIKRMIAEAVAADLTRRIFGDLSQGGLGTGWLASFANLFANADGGVYSSPSLSQYSGQVVSKPTFFAFARGAGVMGEAGAEAILPLKRNASGQLGVQASGSGHTFHFTLNGITSEADGRRAAGQISRRVLGALAGAQRYA